MGERKMNWQRWHRIGLAAAVAASLAVGAVRAEPPAPAAEPVIIFREAGKPDRKCVIEKTTAQADGTFLHELRDVATGEKFRVVDSKRHKGLIGAANARVAAANPSMPTPYGAQMTAKKPSEPRRVSTTAEEAGYVTPPDSSTEVDSRFTGVFRRTKPASITLALQVQMQKLKEGATPAERENAAATLTLGDAHTNPEVQEALIAAARSDPSANVRAFLVRCLCRLANESPSLAAVIQEMQSDNDEEVSRTAQMAMQQFGKK
jgi:hypothetical protein